MSARKSGGLRRQLKAAENKALTVQAALAQAERDHLEATRSLERYSHAQLFTMLELAAVPSVQYMMFSLNWQAGKSRKS